MNNSNYNSSGRSKGAPTISAICVYCPVRRTGICSKCTPAELSELDRLRHFETFAPNELIIRKGEKIDCVGSIISGTAALTETDGGKTRILQLFRPGDTTANRLGTTARFDLRATTQTRICCFEADQFGRSLLKLPNVAARSREMLEGTIASLRDQMLVLQKKTARERVACFILWLIETRHGTRVLPNGHIEIDLPLSRADTASYLGLRIEAISRELVAMKKAGIVEIMGHRGLLVADLKKIEEFAQGK